MMHNVFHITDDEFLINGIYIRTQNILEKERAQLQMSEKVLGTCLRSKADEKREEHSRGKNK